jgi:hypothetical protein
MPDALLHAVLPMRNSCEDGQTNWGYGHIEIGIEYRILSGSPVGRGLMAGIFPIVVVSNVVSEAL